MKNKHTMGNGTCIIPGAVAEADYEAEPDRRDRRPVIINGPPEGRCCQICGHHISELDPFGGAGDPLVGDFSGMKLVKKFREDLPGYIGASWECRDSFVRYGGLWELNEEDRLGRELTDDERFTMRIEIERQLCAGDGDR